MTVLEVIQNGARFLEDKGVDSPRLQVELLLAGVLQLPRLQLYLNFDRRLSDVEIARAREWVQRRGRREPLQHILGTANFLGLELEVTPDVLIPRPETELLAERAAKFLREREHPTVLDLGTGSGCLPIYLTHAVPDATALALDVSPAALAVARRNATTHGVDTRITFRESDGFAAVEREARFDLIVSNPPYIPAAEIATLQPEVRDFDPRLALDGGEDGLSFYRMLSEGAARFLKTDGKLMAEFGDGQADAVRRLFEARDWTVEEVVSDYRPTPRFLIARPDKR